MRMRPGKFLLYVATLGGIAAVVRHRLADARPAPAPVAREPFMQPSRSIPSAAVRPPDGLRDGGATTGAEAVEPPLPTVSPGSTSPVGAVVPAPADHAEADSPTPESEADTAEIPTVSLGISEADLDQATAGIMDDDATPPSITAIVPGDGLALPDPPHGPFTQPPDGPADDLKRISGVGPKLERLLNEQGITTLAQVADLSDVEVDVLQRRIAQFPGRIRRDRWVEQARRLMSR